MARGLSGFGRVVSPRSSLTSLPGLTGEALAVTLGTLLNELSLIVLLETMLTGEALVVTMGTLLKARSTAFHSSSLLLGANRVFDRCDKTRFLAQRHSSLLLTASRWAVQFPLIVVLHNPTALARNLGALNMAWGKDSLVHDALNPCPTKPACWQCPAIQHTLL
eukprot:scaffold75744_cov21-Tisochrysis_lutea.AAC.8